MRKFLLLLKTQLRATWRFGAKKKEDGEKSPAAGTSP